MHFHAATRHPLFLSRSFGGGDFAVVANIHLPGCRDFDSFDCLGFCCLCCGLSESGDNDEACGNGEKCECSDDFVQLNEFLCFGLNKFAYCPFQADDFTVMEIVELPQSINTRILLQSSLYVESVG